MTITIKKKDVYISRSTDRKQFEVIITTKSLNQADEIIQQIFKDQKHVKTIEKRLHAIDSWADRIAIEASLNMYKLREIELVTDNQLQTLEEKMYDIKRILRKRK